MGGESSSRPKPRLTDSGGTWPVASATAHPLPDDSAPALITDPPYYDAVPYAYLSDFFYVWLRRSLADIHPELFATQLTPKDEEIVVDRHTSSATSQARRRILRDES